MAEIRIISRPLDDSGKLHEVGAVLDDTRFVVIRPNIEDVDGRPAYRLDSWIFRVLLPIEASVSEIEIRDKSTGGSFVLPIAVAEREAMREAGPAGFDWAIPRERPREEPEPKRENDAFSFLD